MNPLRPWITALTTIKGPRPTVGGDEYMLSGKIILGHMVTNYKVAHTAFLIAAVLLLVVEPALKVAFVTSLIGMVVFEIGDVVRYIKAKRGLRAFADSAFDLLELSGAAWLYGGVLLFGPLGLLALPAHALVVVAVSPIRGRFG